MHDMHTCMHIKRYVWTKARECAEGKAVYFMCAHCAGAKTIKRIQLPVKERELTVQVNGVKIRTRRPTSSTLTCRHAYHYTHSPLYHSALTLYILSRGAFGGPSPASLTACTAPPPRPPSPTRPHPTPYLALIYASAERAKHNVLHVGVRRNACRTRVDDRHARVAGCGDLGRQSP